MIETTEYKKLIIEIISTLINLKNEMVQKILLPSGVSKDIYAPILRQIGENGKPLTKREMAPKIIEAIEKKSNSDEIFRNIIQIASTWNDFSLAYDEYQARATVQKARVVMNNIEIMEELEAKQREENRKRQEAIWEEERKRQEKEREVERSKQLDLLLMMYDSLTMLKEDPQKRGYLLEDLIVRLFDLFDFPVVKSFRRNDNGEQIDGAFKMGGWHYISEIKWRSKLSDIRQLDGLLGQVNRSGKQTMGMFLSIEGWSSNVIPLLKQNPDKSIFLVDGYDLRLVLNRDLSLPQLLEAKLAKLNLEAEPFMSGKELLD